MSHSGHDKKVANSLVALSSAAVLAVYTAGFFKTKAAADHLEALESRVKLGMSASPGETPRSSPAPAVVQEVRATEAPPAAVPPTPAIPQPPVTKAKDPSTVAEPAVAPPESKPEVQPE